MAPPTLVVVSGPAGSGKTTLAHRLAQAIGCPAVCRDEIKEGMVHTEETFEAALGDELTLRSLPVFFDVLRLLLERGVTVVAEAAFQDKVWSPNLVPLRDLAELRIVQCHTDVETARQRIATRGTSRTAHADAAVLESGEKYLERFDRVAIEAPSLDVDTTDGYDPPMEEIVAFVNGEPAA